MSISISSIVRRLESLINNLKRIFSPVVERAVDIFNKKWTIWAAFALLPVFVLIYYPSRTEDYDLWYHLAFGRHFITNMTCELDHSIFSWTPADPGWRYGIWLGSSLLYIVFTLFSATGLYVLQWVLFIAIVLLYLKFIKLIGDSLDATHIFSLLLLFVALNLTEIYIKPEMFTTLFFTIAVFLYFYIKFTSRNLFYLYPPLLFLWVNTHGGYLMGLFFISLALAGEAFNYLILKRNHLPGNLVRHFAIAVVASYVAVIFNPYGLDYHVAIIKGFLSEKYMSYGMQVLAWENMWGSLLRGGAYRFFNTAWILVFAVASFFGLSIYAFVKKRFVDVTLLLLNGAFFYIGMKAARITIFLPLLWMFSVLYVLKMIEALSLKKKLAPLSLACFLLIGVYLTQTTITTLEDRSWFGTNILKYAPVKEVEFIKKYKLPGPIFNDYVIGAYLIWTLYPEYKVFIDPRYGPYWKETGPDYFNFMNHISPAHFEWFHAKYPFRVVVVDLKEGDLIGFLMSLPDWKLLFFDKSAAIIVHASVLSELSIEALSVDMSTSKFADVDNPEVLEAVFHFYLNAGPRYAREVMNIYQRNVSDFYLYKQYQLQKMRYLVGRQEAMSGRGGQPQLPPGHP